MYHLLFETRLCSPAVTSDNHVVLFSMKMILQIAVLEAYFIVLIDSLMEVRAFFNQLFFLFDREALYGNPTTGSYPKPLQSLFPNDQFNHSDSRP
jgi:hypothetical protein